MGRPSPHMTPMSFDPTQWRAQFPALGASDAPLHYLDNAATTQTPACVIEAVAAHDRAGRANVKRSVHRLAERATQAFEAARHDASAYLGAAHPDEVIFTSGATDAINLVAWALTDRIGPGDQIAVSLAEHHSNLVPWQLLAARCGATLVPLPLDAHGRIDETGALEAVNGRTRLIALTHVSNVTGFVTPLETLVPALRAQAPNALVLADGAQGAPHGPLSMDRLGADFYALSGHKLFGPTGIGVLWGKADLLAELPPAKGGGEMIRSVSFERSQYADPPHRFEAGTPPITQAIGLGEALRFIQATDMDAAEAHIHALAERFALALKEQFGNRVTLHTPALYGADRVGIVPFTLAGIHPHDVCQILDGTGVAMRGGHHCAQPLMTHWGVPGCVRASLAPYNTDDDIDAALAGIARVLDLLGKQ